MSESIIKVENLSKKFKIGTRESYYSLRDKIAEAFSFKKKEMDNSDFWALKDVNFEVKAGESIGIIGRNGAGKSTLLKVLSQITPPTTGKITMKGRVASLLEVGTGFNPELTGRENIFLNGAILGMTRAEIKRKFDEIVAFSEIEQFLDTPVKRYSSGMYMRLAFAVAAHLESEILIVDEVLAVGDAQFQKKCLGKMNDVTKKEGRTVLFVSHNMGAIEALCNNGILLNSGMVSSIGKIEKVVKEYSKSLMINPELSKHTESEIWVKEIYINQADNSGKVRFFAPFEIEMSINSEKDLNAIVGLDFTNELGNVVTTLHTVEIGMGDEEDNEICKFKKGENKIKIIINNNVFRPGQYQIGISIFSRKFIKNYFRNESVCTLEVTNNGNQIYFDDRQQGIFFLQDIKWQK